MQRVSARQIYLTDSFFQGSLGRRLLVRRDDVSSGAQVHHSHEQCISVAYKLLDGGENPIGGK